MLLLGALSVIFVASSIEGAKPPADPSILIIGSGPSGIAAATKLLKNGFNNFKILEAEGRIGGRIHSVKFGEAYVDLGAEFCHGEESNIVYSMVKDLNLLKPTGIKGSFFISNGEEAENSTKQKIMDFAEKLNSNNDPIPGCENVTSVGDCLDIKFKTLVESGKDDKEKEVLSNTMDTITSYISGYDSPLDLHDLKSTTLFQTSKGDQTLNWDGHGYKTILEIMMQKYPDPTKQLPIDDKILLSHKVANVSWQDGNKVKVVTENNTMFEADHVIFTPSLGVLKASHQHIFKPQLPEEKIEAIKNMGYGAIAKVIVHFPERWWGNTTWWSFIWTKEDREKLTEMNLSWLRDISAFVQAENNPNVLVVWVAGGFVPYIETLSEDKVMEGVKYLINTFLPTHFNVTMPDTLIRTNWYSNPNFKGTYSYESTKGYLAGGKNLQEKLGKPLKDKDGKPVVLFAGEATHPYYFSTVHGAIETGYREADRLIHWHKKYIL
ncbi:spermine oxidase-like [Anthonomus grandis grandis]|uniref:spermine oxidase-like n=1 Tax=Anthonomus grandis grandis TaxID=2921223 RepID=UPI0021668691|nr:spermine oxidase-like [Anthonomus grandis grandis]